MANNNLPEYYARWTHRLLVSIHKDAPLIVGNRALSLFKKNFQNESFFGEKWPEVIRRIGKEYLYTGKNGRTYTRRVKIASGARGQRKILTGDTGDLGRSLWMQTRDAEVEISSDLVYSAIHNDGGLAGRGHRSVIPRRRYMGAHPSLEKELLDVLNKFLDKHKNTDI